MPNPLAEPSSYSFAPLRQVPADLFIPPDALEVYLESFTGPLDLLLYLIKRQNIDILNIPIAEISQQYLQYIRFMERQRLELAADYLVMAAMLAEIKSRLLLPSPANSDDELEDDPRLILVRKLQLYEQFKTAASSIDALPRLERDFFLVTSAVELKSSVLYPEIKLNSLIRAMQGLIKLRSQLAHHRIEKEPLSVRERMRVILECLQEKKSLEFLKLVKYREGRLGLVVSLLAILELTRQTLIILYQVDSYSTIYLEKNLDGR